MAELSRHCALQGRVEHGEGSFLTTARFSRVITASISPRAMLSPTTAQAMYRPRLPPFQSHSYTIEPTHPRPRAAQLHFNIPHPL